MQKQNPWTPKEIEDLRNLYPSTNTDDIALVIRRSPSAIAHKASKLRLQKSEEFMNSKLSGRFVRKESFYNKLLNFIRSCFGS